MDSIRSVQNAIDYIEEHLDEKLELQEIASRSFMSLPNLYRAFYALTGHPIKEYIRKRRISISATHLKYSAKPAVSIAYEIGFDSYEAYTKAFKKWVGLTPGAYRVADLQYTFESINLLENVSYLEERELSYRYPDVKVIRVASMEVAVYQYRSTQEEGIEEEAIRVAMEELTKIGWDFRRLRLFGSNVDLPSKEKPFGYEVMIPVDASNRHLVSSMFHICHFHGGLYAIGKSSESEAKKIVAEWDRLVTEWLPKSTFKLGDHPYVEEYLIYQGVVNRMKLYLPVKRKPEYDTLELVIKDPFPVFGFKRYGPSAQKHANEEIIAWLTHHGLSGVPGLSLFMSYSYGAEPDEDYWYELGVSVPEQLQSGLAMQTSTLGGGLYACLTTGACGLMTGVLDKLHRWLYGEERFSLDENRQWFVEYVSDGGADLERTTVTKCYIPIIH